MQPQEPYNFDEPLTGGSVAAIEVVRGVLSTRHKKEPVQISYATMHSSCKVVSRSSPLINVAWS